MGKGLVGCLAIVVLVAGLVMWGVGVHNELVGLDENVNTAWAQVENASSGAGPSRVDRQGGRRRPCGDGRRGRPSHHPA